MKQIRPSLALRNNVHTFDSLHGTRYICHAMNDQHDELSFSLNSKML
jgi:hypothetical protein